MRCPLNYQRNTHTPFGQSASSHYWWHGMLHATNPITSHGSVMGERALTVSFSRVSIDAAHTSVRTSSHSAENWCMEAGMDHHTTRPPRVVGLVLNTNYQSIFRLLPTLATKLHLSPFLLTSKLFEEFVSGNLANHHVKNQ